MRNNIKAIIWVVVTIVILSSLTISAYFMIEKEWASSKIIDYVMDSPNKSSVQPLSSNVNITKINKCKDVINYDECYGRDDCLPHDSCSCYNEYESALRCGVTPEVLCDCDVTNFEYCEDLECDILSNTNTAIDTSDWLTYENEEYGYSIKYPSDWLFNSEFIDNGDLYILTPERQAKMDAGKMVRIFDVLVKVYRSISELPNNSKKQLSFDDWINQKTLDYCFNFDPTMITIDNKQGYQGKCSGESVTYHAYIQNKGYVYSLATGDTATPDSTEQAIINSFLFTE